VEAAGKPIKHFTAYDLVSKWTVAKAFNRATAASAADLSDATAQRGLYDFVGANGTIKHFRLNIGTTKDGRSFREHHLI
jgi:hypothetical protein